MQKTKEDNYDYGEKIVKSEKDVGKRFFAALTTEIAANDKTISDDAMSMSNDFSKINTAIMSGDWDSAKQASEDYNEKSAESSQAQSKNDILKKTKSDIQSL
jgi:DNA-binding FadR family transcriptional regulator